MLFRVFILLILYALMVPSAQAQTAESEITPTDFVPLEVGNQWTYEHDYFNTYYQSRDWESLRDWNPEVRMLFEIPGYPYDSPESPPDSLLWADDRELTIEITHTEMIEGSEYFVFSRADYDWPPLPEFFWAGQKVRLSDEGILLFRWNEQDVPLYDLNPQHPSEYLIPAYPIREGIFTKLAIERERTWDGRNISFSISFPEIHPTNMSYIINVGFKSGYGPVYSEYYDLVTGFDDVFSELSPFFFNYLTPISAIISGESVSYKQILIGNTSVQPTSWGQLKAHHGQSP